MAFERAFAELRDFERFWIIGELEGGVFIGSASERFCTIGELEGDVLVDFAELEEWLAGVEDRR